MALTIEEQHETNDLDHDILATREVTFICGHKRVYEDISACQKSWMERCQRCPNCQYKRDKAYVEKLSAEINSPELLEMWLKETPPTKTSRKGAIVLREGTPSFRAVVNHSGRFWFSMYRFSVFNGAPPAVPA